MTRAAAWTVCIFAWVVAESVTSWIVVSSAAGGRRRPRLHRATAAPTQQFDGCRPTSHAQRAAQSLPCRLTACDSADDTTNSGKDKRSSLPGVPLFAIVNAAASDDGRVDGAARGASASLSKAAAVKAAKVSARVAKAAESLLLVPAPEGKDDSTTSKCREPLNGTGAKGAATTASITATASSAAAVDDGATAGEPWRARLVLAVVACLYGTNYTAIKFMGGFMDTSSLLTLRFGLASVALLPALRGVRRDVLLAGAEVGVWATLGYGAQAYAMRSLPASQLALVGCLAVLVVPFLDQISGRRKTGVATFCASLLACGGAALLQTKGIDAGAAEGAAGLLPQALAFMQPFCFGLSTWRMEAHVQNHPSQALPLTASQVAVVAVTSALWGIVGGGFPSGLQGVLANPGTDPWALAVLLWLGLITTALVLFLETDALESVSASEATVIYSLEPLVGAGLASFALGEPFPSPLGASLVLGGCLCSSFTDSGVSSGATESEA